jgi:O-antigen/teichoic acid export membrane protein
MDRVKTESSLTRKVIQGSLWVVTGFAVSSALRLAGNLILTRLLFPEAFGLMTIVTVVLVGVQLFSDFGIRGSIVYHERGEDPAFLNTAWTLQIIRGLALWIFIAGIAWPMATFYEKPELLVLLPLVGLTAIIDGFASTARFTLIRRLTPARQVALELGARVISLCVVIAWAIVSPSIWALVAGSLAMSLANTILSYALIPGSANRLRLERAAFLSLFGYGRWVFLATGLSFLLSQGDRAVLGKILSSEQLGVYSIAIVITEAVLQPIQALANSILQPLHARLANNTRDERRGAILRTRAVLLTVAIPGVWVLVIFGDQIIQFLYDERYWDAGWMLRILAVGIIGSILGATSDRAMLAAGDSLSYLRLQILRSMLLLIAMTAGYATEGFAGLLVGLSCARILEYIPLAFFLRRHDVWLPKLDLAVLGISIAVIALGVGITSR